MPRRPPRGGYRPPAHRPHPPPRWSRPCGRHRPHGGQRPRSRPPLRLPRPSEPSHIEPSHIAPSHIAPGRSATRLAAARPIRAGPPARTPLGRRAADRPAHRPATWPAPRRRRSTRLPAARPTDPHPHQPGQTLPPRPLHRHRRGAPRSPSRPPACWSFAHPFSSAAPTPAPAGKVIAEYDYRFTAPPGWSQSGGSDAQLEVQIAPGGTANAPQSIYVAEFRLNFDSTANRAQAVTQLRELVDSNGYQDFNSQLNYAGRPVVYYRESHGDSTVDWYVLFEGKVQVSVGCAYPNGAGRQDRCGLSAGGQRHEHQRLSKWITGEDPMTDPMAGFNAELDAAVARARRVAAETRETSARFRRETRQLAERTRAGAVRPKSETDLTTEHLRRAATGFRADHGLPVESLPDGRELLTQSPAPAHRSHRVVRGSHHRGGETPIRMTMTRTFRKSESCSDSIRSCER